MERLLDGRLVCLVLGLGFAVWGGMDYAYQARLDRDGIEAVATVAGVRVIPGWTRHSVQRNQITLRFTDAEGVARRVVTTEHGTLPLDRYSRVTVRYLPDSPERVRIERRVGDHGVGAVVLSFRNRAILQGALQFGVAAIFLVVVGFVHFSSPEERTGRRR